MEEYNTTTTQEGIEVYESEVLEYLDRYIAEHNIKDMRKEPQSRWNAMLIYINRNVFYGPMSKKLKSTEKINNGSKLVNGNKTNCNAYDIDKVNRICDIYIYMCYEYEKEISALGFGKLTGINQDTLYQWGAETSRANSSASEIFKKLHTEREESLSNKLVSNKGNALGLLGVLNRHYGWNMGQPKNNNALPKQRETAQIAADYGLQIEEKEENTTYCAE